jgi:hypothetical protein
MPTLNAKKYTPRQRRRFITYAWQARLARNRAALHNQYKGTGQLKPWTCSNCKEATTSRPAQSLTLHTIPICTECSVLERMILSAESRQEDYV